MVYLVPSQGFRQSPAKKNIGSIAQLGEHLPYKQRVIGSSPIGPISLFLTNITSYGEMAQLARAFGSYPEG